MTVFSMETDPPVSGAFIYARATGIDIATARYVRGLMGRPMAGVPLGSRLIGSLSIQDAHRTLGLRPASAGSGFDHIFSR